VCSKDAGESELCQTALEIILSGYFFVIVFVAHSPYVKYGSFRYSTIPRIISLKMNFIFSA